MSLSILLIGAGAVGSAVAAWLAPHHRSFYVYDKPQTVEVLSKSGITAYLQHHTSDARRTPVKTVSTLCECPIPDVILLCVKNYSLENLSKDLVDTYGEQALSQTIIVGLQNGVENQKILPRYFKRVVYGVVSFNAWLDETGVVGFQAKGPFIFGTPDNHNEAATEKVVQIFNQGVPAVKSKHFQDAALCKMIINLTNSFTTLTGLGYQEISNMSLFQKILSRLTYEGVNIVKAAGYKECKVGDTPTWLLIRASALLPQFLTRGFFKRNVNKMVLSSMAQDVIKNGSGQTELEDINGHLLALAQQHEIDAPYNQAIYKLCREQFKDASFKPMSVEQVWQKMAV